MRILSLLCLAAAWVPAQAAPFIVSDPYPAASQPQPTHCGFFMDATAKQTVPVAKNEKGQVYCKLDIANLAVGSHTVTATHIVTGDKVWGNVESPKSAPYTFTRPGPAGAPTGLTLSNT